MNASDRTFTSDEITASVPEEISLRGRFSFLFDVGSIDGTGDVTAWVATFEMDGDSGARFWLNLEQERQMAFPESLPLTGYLLWNRSDLLVALEDPELGTLQATMVAAGLPGDPDLDPEERLTSGQAWKQIAETAFRCALGSEDWPTVRSQ